MGLKDRFSRIFSDDEYDENEDEAVEEEAEAAPAPAHAAAPAPAARTQTAKTAGVGSNTNLEMKIMKPENFESVTQVADQLLSGRTVVLNMEEANQDLLRHILDFCSGVVYAVHGNMKRAGASTYILTPKNVGITSEQNADGEADGTAQRDLF